MALLCDLGGTHIRFAGSDSTGALVNPVKWAAADFSGFADAVQHYAHKEGISTKDGVLLAATGSLSRPWQIDAVAAQAAGVKIIAEVSDFEASAWGVPELTRDQIIPLRAAPGMAGEPRAILGPGTGLGLAYMLPDMNGHWRIQKTHGGHMQAALVTEEHLLLAELLGKLRGTGHTVIYENFVAGRNLPLLYRAVCQMLDENEQPARSAEDLLRLEMDEALRATLRIFHEMLGLFAHSALLFLNAFDGLYLDGGMIPRLRERNLFDADTVLHFMTLNPVATVRADLDKTPVWMVDDPMIALRGLAAMARAGQFPRSAK